MLAIRNAVGASKKIKMVVNGCENDNLNELFENCPLYKIPKNDRYKFLRDSMKKGKWVDSIQVMVFRKEFGVLANVLVNIKLSKCYLCNKQAHHRHHVIPLCRGGRNDISNIVPLCVKCHKKFSINRLNNWKQRNQPIKPWVPKGFKSPFTVRNDVVIVKNV